ncbi:MAG: DUF58 domain-containing protein [Planctomycetota bacterium]|nr:MAG: DUF58 domain-containing protein [Planctomycetota bacterium]
MRWLERLEAAWYPSPEQPSSFPRLWALWRGGLTDAGRALLGVASVATLVALAYLHGGFPLYAFVVFLWTLFWGSLALGWLSRPRVRLERRFPERVAAGAQVEVRVRVRNEGWLPGFDLEAGEWIPPRNAHRVQLGARREALAELAPGEEATLRHWLSFPRRGAYEVWGAELRTAFPFGLVRCARRQRDPVQVLVTPRFRPMAGVDLPVGRRHQPGGLALVSRVGESEEFIGNREYRSGDRLRDLDQRAWARVGAPVVREYQQEYLTRIALVLDTYAAGQPRGETSFEAAVSLGAAVADVLSRREYIIDLFAAGPDLYHLMAGRSLASLEKVLDLLACVEPCPQNPFATLAPSLFREVDRIATAVLILLDWDEDRRRFVQALADHGVALKVAVVRDGPTRLPPHVPVAGEPIACYTPAEVEAGIEAW